MTTRERPWRPAGLSGYLLAFLATAVVGGVAGGVAATLAEFGRGGIVAIAVCAAVGLSLITVICVAWWSRVDEAAREAHKWAWWWGGTAGTAIAGVCLIVAVAGARGEVSGIMTSASAADLVYGGGMVVLLFQVVGYGIAWAFWWLQRR